MEDAKLLFEYFRRFFNFIYFFMDYLNVFWRTRNRYMTVLGRKKGKKQDCGGTISLVPELTNQQLSWRMFFLQKKIRQNVGLVAKDWDSKSYLAHFYILYHCQVVGRNSVLGGDKSCTLYYYKKTFLFVKWSLIWLLVRNKTDSETCTRDG